MAHAKMLALTDSEIVELETIIRQRTNQAQIVDQSKMLLYKSQGMTNGEIAERLDVNINTVHKSKKVRAYLATRPEGRFTFVFTPTHGS